MPGVELLWRPVAIALDFLNNKGRENLNDKVQLLIIDTDSYFLELTVLKLEYFNKYLVPVRTLPEPNQRLFGDYSSFELKLTFIKKISSNDDEAEKLVNGPFSADIFNFLESNKKSDIFLRSGLSHYKFNLKDEWIEEIKDHSVNDFNFQKVKEIVHETEEYQESDYVLWNGFSSRIQNKENFSEKEIQRILNVAKDSLDKNARLFILDTFLDKQKNPVAEYILRMTSLYFTCFANGNSKIYHSNTIINCIKKAGLVVKKETNHIGLGHTLLECTNPD